RPRGTGPPLRRPVARRADRPAPAVGRRPRGAAVRVRPLPGVGQTPPAALQGEPARGTRRGVPEPGMVRAAPTPIWGSHPTGCSPRLAAGAAATPLPDRQALRPPAGAGAVSSPPAEVVGGRGAGPA